MNQSDPFVDWLAASNQFLTSVTSLLRRLDEACIAQGKSTRWSVEENVDGIARTLALSILRDIPDVAWTWMDAHSANEAMSKIARESKTCDDPIITELISAMEAEYRKQVLRDPLWRKVNLQNERLNGNSFLRIPTEK